MSFWTALKSFITTTEADVVEIIAKVKTGAQVAERDISDALHWVASNAPSITSDIQSVVGVAEAVGVAGNPEVVAAITAANLAVDGLNAFAAAANSGKSEPQAVVAGYVAAKQAQAAAASAAAAAAQAPTTK